MMKSIFNRIWDILFSTAPFTSIESHKRVMKKHVGDKYEVNTMIAGRDADEMYIMLNPRDGDYLTGKMESISNDDKNKFKKRFSDSRKKFVPAIQTPDSNSSSDDKTDDNAMKYYLSVDEELVNASQDLFETEYPLCTRSFGTVYPQDGMKVLNSVITKHESYHDSIEIHNEDGETVSFDEFSDMLNDNTVLTNQ